MPGDEIEVPKELREFMLEEAEETILGQKNGAVKQYRYGNLHIREYPDKFLVHNDRIDPRKDPIGHLVYDAPRSSCWFRMCNLWWFTNCKKSF